MLRRDSNCSLNSASDDVILNDECLSKAQAHFHEEIIDSIKLEEEQLEEDDCKNFDLIDSSLESHSLSQNHRPLSSYPSLYGKPISATPYQNTASRVIPRKRYIIIAPSTASPSLSGMTSRNSAVVNSSFSSLGQQPVKSFVNGENTSNNLSSSVAIRVPHEIDIHTSNMRMQTSASQKYILKIPTKRQGATTNTISKSTPTCFPTFAPMRRTAIPNVSAVNNEQTLGEDAKSAMYRRTLRTTSYKITDQQKYQYSKPTPYSRSTVQFPLNRHIISPHDVTLSPSPMPASSALRLSSGPLTSARGLRPASISQQQAHTAPPSPNSAAKVTKPKGVKCSECGSYAYSRPLLIKHMWKEHGIQAPIIHRAFDNREELQIWLDSLRQTHAVEFVVSSGSKKWGRGLQVHYLTCSRSGEQKERPNKKFIRQPRPSIKCGRNCMAYLKIKQNPTVSTLQIEGCLHHSGHEIDAQNVVLEDEELRKIATLCYEMNKDKNLMLKMENMNKIRNALGYSGRFRLMTDQGLLNKLPEWISEWENYKTNMDFDFYERIEEEKAEEKYGMNGQEQNDEENNELIKTEPVDEFLSSSLSSPLPDDTDFTGEFKPE
ncbi:hypothetical protein WR25_02469 [Diploscapter pachys]|uniref:C2H2-type domain-containing protein n=1 Tax=Diploscapter pachys TaxID=2018661 RepID=A0A2A2KKR8_9BILA|nr:hypothetical protein WR25_02469 [Diploscapter pachys]